MKHNPQDDKL